MFPRRPERPSEPAVAYMSTARLISVTVKSITSSPIALISGVMRKRIMPRITTGSGVLDAPCRKTEVTTSWFALFGPPGMAPDVVGKINAEVRRIFADPEFRKTFLERQYFESITGTPEELTARIKADEPKWRKVIEQAKIKPE